MRSLGIHLTDSMFEKVQRDEIRLNTQARLLARQVKRSPFVVLPVSLVILYAVLPTNPTWLAVSWLVMVALCLGLRYRYAHWVLHSDISQNPAKQIMSNLTWFALINGLAIGISAPLFFNGMGDAQRAIVGMVLVGLSAGGIATSAAYPPVFVAYILPALLPMAASWAWAGGAQHWLIGVLVLLFIIILYSFVRENNKLLAESFLIRFEREKLVLELEIKQAELLTAMEQAKQAAEKAEEAGQAKARVLAAASHDLRQPLHALSLYSAVLSQTPDAQTLAAVSQQIDLSVRALGALLNALLDISRLDAGVYQIEERSFAADEVLERIMQEFQNVAQKKGLMLYLTKKPVQAYTDPVVFEQIARNLLENAIKYTDSGAVLLSIGVEDDRIRVSVQDTGKGIPVAEQMRIFEEFYQLDNPGRNRELGLGLGLSIVKRLAELTKSEISLTSVVGEGSCFSWHLPLDRRSNISPAGQIEHERMTAMNKRMQILVVEDEAAIRYGMKLLLQTWDMDGHGAATQLEAEQILAQQPIDLIIADLRLQDGANGLNVVNALRKRWKDLPVILISGETDPSKLRDVAASGFPLMNKPIQPETLRKNILQLVDETQTTMHSR